MRKPFPEEWLSSSLSLPMLEPVSEHLQEKLRSLNTRASHLLPCYLPPYGGDYPFRLMTAPSFYALNSTFRERKDLLKKEKAMFLQMSPADAEAKGLKEGAKGHCL